jgi:hypothetical protein
MAQGYSLTRRFFQLYGAAGAWGVAGGGVLTLTSGQTIFGALILAAAAVLLYLALTGRLVKQRTYTGTDLFFLSLPFVGVILIGAIYFVLFPWLYGILFYLAGFIVLSALAFIEFRRSSPKLAA